MLSSVCCVYVCRVYMCAVCVCAVCVCVMWLCTNALRECLRASSRGCAGALLLGVRLFVLYPCEQICIRTWTASRTSPPSCMASLCPSVWLRDVRLTQSFPWVLPCTCLQVRPVDGQVRPVSQGVDQAAGVRDAQATGAQIEETYSFSTRPGNTHAPRRQQHRRAPRCRAAVQ